MVRKNTTFGLHRIEGHISTVFLADYGDRLLMLDGGSRTDARRVEQLCRTLGHDPSRIELAVVTHMHPDHVGAAALLRRRHGIPIAAHPRIDRWYGGPSGAVQHKMDWIMTRFAARRSGKSTRRLLAPRQIAPEHPLADGSPLPGFEDWRALHVPGHTAFDIALYNESAGVLYVADLVVRLKDGLSLPLPVMFPEQMRASLDRLAALPVETVLLAHGEPVETAGGDASELFGSVRRLLDEPWTPMMRKVRLASVFSPVVWRSRLGTSTRDD